MIAVSLGFLNLTFIDIVDILLVAAIMYAVFRWIRGSSAVNIFLAIIIFVIARILVAALGMKMMSTLLGTVMDVGAVALIVIFQPEIRRFLNRIGRGAGNTLEKRRKLIDRFLPREDDQALGNDAITEIAQACDEMSQQKTGALIVLRKKNSLEDVMATGDAIDAHISSRLIMNIFFKNSPLHDGAMVIGDGRIMAARCTLPITDRNDLPASYGMRHKAAVGISEQSDAHIIVVSEETGRISYVSAGKVTRIDSITTLKLLLGGKAE